MKLEPCLICKNEVHFCGPDGFDEPGHECHIIICPNCGTFDLANGGEGLETLAELREFIAKRWNQRHTGWVSVDDDMPELQKTVFAYTDKGKFYHHAWTSMTGDGLCWSYINGGGPIWMTENVTHWMEKPQPPKAKDDK